MLEDISQTYFSYVKQMGGKCVYGASAYNSISLINFIALYD